ncbi:SHD1 domain-containing protein [Candidatus Laterigemmans baculatus]|uniref:SHD1 domain-containing protein n=1 Tax=Candidatus Laterigemmans baculatus TaxID=2770505 RepID=UPI0013DBDFD4|nr:SHD1 domain-containing protein [Candidatus Laterigemmans baculatus]
MSASIAGRRSPRRRVALGLLALGATSLTGCMVNTVTQGDATIYSNSPLNTLLLAAVGCVVFGFGVAFCLVGLFARESAVADVYGGYHQPPRSRWKLQNVLSLLGGCGLMMGGGLILLLGVPSSWMAHITIYPDRVVLRDSVIWFATEDREVPFETIADITREEKPIVRKRRPAEDLVIHYRDGSAQRIEMGPKERAAYDELLRAYHAFRSGDGRTPGMAGTEVASARAVAQASPTEPRGRSEPGWLKAVDEPFGEREPSGANEAFTYDRSRDDLIVGTEGPNPAGSPDASSMSPPAESRAAAIRERMSAAAAGLRDSNSRNIKRYPITIPLPEDAAAVDAQTPLEPGMKLGACYARRWEVVTVVAVHEDGTVRCNWDDWPAFTYDMSRDDLIITEAVLAEVQGPQQRSEPSEREWSDVSGKFKVTATYIGFEQGFVKLRKSDGEEISVPIQKLSEADRKLVLRLSRQN